MSDLPVKQTDKELADSMSNQHGVYGLLGRVYLRLGGEDRFMRWADENESQFYKMMFATAPSVQPVTAVQGDVHLHVHPALAPTDLDVISEQ